MDGSIRHWEPHRHICRPYLLRKTVQHWEKKRLVSQHNGRVAKLAISLPLQTLPNDVARILALQHTLGATDNRNGFATSHKVTFIIADIGKQLPIPTKEKARFLPLVVEVEGVAVGV